MGRGWGTASSQYFLESRKVKLEKLRLFPFHAFFQEREPEKEKSIAKY
ncbi:hypothetical protein B4119_2268 [Parageobacillus caldoxylosilyticus]|jgi:hypothetical protein|uniref:Uncharacterized protein n=1 Tax=Saccharococcus caldoxylosilyticus TaxID=81408 RepID=A0A150LUB5_9BACL|nr:hypothetical protein B4119_2268 [Parageobacillus caldoxylosilyticus]